jgi:hypothetical protein
MEVEVGEESVASLGEQSLVSIAFDYDSILDRTVPGSGLGGFVLTDWSSCGNIARIHHVRLNVVGRYTGLSSNLLSRSAFSKPIFHFSQGARI